MFFDKLDLHREKNGNTYFIIYAKDKHHILIVN